MTDTATRTLADAARPRSDAAAPQPETRAEIRLPTQELRDDIPFFTRVLKMRLDMIFPADNPAVAVFSGHGLRVRVEKGAPEAPGTIRILAADPDAFAGGERRLTAPNGTRVEIEPLDPPLVIPPTEHAFVVRRLKDQAPWIIGRAGMRYRDLVPSRLGGSIIASHISVPAGPVPDMVHYHKVGFQLIFCYKGWVDLVYEDQGEPFRLAAGNCVIQPPTIRHRVLHASDNLQVIEIGVPAAHVTEIDHEMTLPNAAVNTERRWDGQRFVHHRAEGAAWALGGDAAQPGPGRPSRGHRRCSGTGRRGTAGIFPGERSLTRVTTCTIVRDRRRPHGLPHRESSHRSRGAGVHLRHGRGDRPRRRARGRSLHVLARHPGGAAREGAERRRGRVREPR